MTASPGAGAEYVVPTGSSYYVAALARALADRGHRHRPRGAGGGDPAAGHPLDRGAAARLRDRRARLARRGTQDPARSPPCAFRDTLGVRDVLLLVSDGAWTPLGTAGLERAVRSMTTRAFTDVPAAVLDQASRRGRADDMAVVALRLLRA